MYAMKVARPVIGGLYRVAVTSVISYDLQSDLSRETLKPGEFVVVLELIERFGHGDRVRILSRLGAGWIFFDDLESAIG